MSSEASLFCLVYISKITPSERSQLRETVRNILTRAQYLNARDAITGLLVFNQSFFAQTLEGDLDAVERTFARIAKDRRHLLPSVVFKRPILERGFSAWTMCARQLSKFDNDILDKLEEGGAFPPAVGSGVALLEQLKTIGRAHQEEFNRQIADVSYL